MRQLAEREKQEMGPPGAGTAQTRAPSEHGQPSAAACVCRQSNQKACERGQRLCFQEITAAI